MIVGGVDFNGILQLNGPKRGLFCHFLAHQIGRVDQVESFAFNNLNGDGGFTIKAGRTGAVCKGQTNIGDIAEGHNPVTIGFDRQIENVDRRIKGGGDLDRKVGIFRVNRACWDQLVVVDHDTNQLAGRHIIRFQLQRIDEHFQHLFSVPGQPGAQNRFETFNPILKILRNLQKRALWHGSRQGNDDDRKFREVKLADRISVAALGKFCLRIAHAIAYIGNDFGLIPTKFKL